ncbi:MAG: site-2 protease family protein [bacterium]
MITLFSFILVVGVLILFHEFGHFIIARLVGINVLKFSVGFGPKIFSIKGKKTEYVLSAIPLGGYIRMAGEQAFLKDEPIKDGDYFSKGPGERALVVLGGPIMNLALAFLCIFAVYTIGYNEYYFTPVIGSVIEKIKVDNVEVSSPAYIAGLKQGDRIISVDGQKIESWSELQDIVFNSKGAQMSLKIARDDSVIDMNIKPLYDKDKNINIIGVYPEQDNIVSFIVPGSPADKSGLKKGDIIMFVGTSEVKTFSEIEEKYKKLDGIVKFTVSRQGERILIKFEKKDDADISSLGFITGMRERIVRKNPIVALKFGARDTGRITYFTIVGVVNLITGRISPKEALGGPLTIADFAGKSARSGWNSLVNYIAILSIMLFILNLLPIPMLDGGNIVINIIEAIKGSLVTLKFRMIYQQVGFFIVISLIALAITMDFIRYVF